MNLLYFEVQNPSGVDCEIWETRLIFGLLGGGQLLGLTCQWKIDETVIGQK